MAEARVIHSNATYQNYAIKLLPYSTTLTTVLAVCEDVVVSRRRCFDLPGTEVDDDNNNDDKGYYDGEGYAQDLLFALHVLLAPYPTLVLRLFLHRPAQLPHHSFQYQVPALAEHVFQYRVRIK